MKTIENFKPGDKFKLISLETLLKKGLIIKNPKGHKFPYREKGTKLNDVAGQISNEELERWNETHTVSWMDLFDPKKPKVVSTLPSPNPKMNIAYEAWEILKKVK